MFNKSYNSFGNDLLSKMLILVRIDTFLAMPDFFVVWIQK